MEQQHVLATGDSISLFTVGESSESVLELVVRPGTSLGTFVGCLAGAAACFGIWMAATSLLQRVSIFPLILLPVFLVVIGGTLVLPFVGLWALLRLNERWRFASSEVIHRHWLGLAHAVYPLDRLGSLQLAARDADAKGNQSYQFSLAGKDGGSPLTLSAPINSPDAARLARLGAQVERITGLPLERSGAPLKPHPDLQSDLAATASDESAGP